MALIKCPRCGKEVSDKAKICPVCNINFKEYEEEQKKLQQIKYEKEQELLRKAEEQKKIEEQKRADEERKKMENKRTCPECGEIIDKNSPIFPKCAYPIKEEEIKKQKEENYMRNCILCVTGIGVVLVALVCVFFSQIKSDKYNEAKKLMKAKNYVEASAKFEDLGDYKDSKTLLKEVDLIQKMQTVLEHGTYDFMYAKSFDPHQVDKLITRLKKYPELKSYREDLIKLLYRVAEDCIIEGYSENYYEYADYLMDTISDYTDVSELENDEKNYKILNNIDSLIREGKYKELYDLFTSIDKADMNSEVKKLYSVYTNLYNKYSKFLGEWDEYELFITHNKGSDAHPNEKEFFLEIDYSGICLDKYNKKDPSGFDYKDLKVSDNALKFTMISSDEIQKVVCSIKDGKKLITIDKEEVSNSSDEFRGGGRRPGYHSYSDDSSDSQGTMVWLSETGSKYHSIPDCGRMNPDKAWQVSESEAEAEGYGRCSKCF